MINTLEYCYGYQEGWVCPKCGAVLSPITMECPHCAPGNQQFTTTTDLKGKTSDYVEVDYSKHISETAGATGSVTYSNTSTPSKDFLSKLLKVNRIKEKK